jgi:hypothetical protein
MNIRIKRLLSVLGIALLLPGCAANQKLASVDRTAMHRVAVNHATSVAGQESGSKAGKIAGSVAQQGASYGMGLIGLGLVGSLATEATKLAKPAKKDEVSQAALKLLAETHTDAGELLAARMERELARNGFVVDSKAPDSVFHFQLEKLTLVPVDSLKLRQRPALGVKATLLGGKGQTLWHHRASAIADESAALPWQEYSTHPRRFRAEFDKLAARIAAQLVAELKQ